MLSMPAVMDDRGRDSHGLLDYFKICGIVQLIRIRFSSGHACKFPTPDRRSSWFVFAARPKRNDIWRVNDVFSVNVNESLTRILTPTNYHNTLG